MKAVVMVANGGPEVLQVREVNEPRIGRDTEVLVRLQAAGVNAIDRKLRRGAAAYPLGEPAVLGCDGAGVVAEVGPAVTDLAVGDEVYFCQPGFGARMGSYAEYVVVDQRLVARKPASLSFELMLTPLYLGMVDAQRRQRQILQEAADLFDAGRLRVHVAESFALADAAEAHRRLEAGSATGKLVIAMGSLLLCRQVVCHAFYPALSPGIWLSVCRSRPVAFTPRPAVGTTLSRDFLKIIRITLVAHLASMLSRGGCSL